MTSIVLTRVAFQTILGLLLASATILFLAYEADAAPKTTSSAVVQPHVQANSPVEAGRYLVTIGMCNDCHTPGFMEADGRIPEQDWLTGSPVGWRGPWGTTYPSNLRPHTPYILLEPQHLERLQQTIKTQSGTN